MKTIAVTGINATDNPGPGVPVLRCLKESDVKFNLIGFTYDVLEPGNFMSDLISSSYVIPYPSSGKELLLERIKYINAMVHIDLIIPTLDSELENFIELREELSKLDIEVRVPSKESMKMREKSHLQETISGDGVLIPDDMRIDDVVTLTHAAEKMGFPFLVKGQFYEAYLAHNLTEANAYFYKLAAKWGIPVIAQKFIDGEEINMALLADQGKLVASVMMKKMVLTDKGKGWAGVTIKNEKAFAIAEKIIERTAWDGGGELEFIIDKETEDIYLLEMNPRFPAWIYLSSAAGSNLPLYQAKNALGIEHEVNKNYDVGKVFVRYSWELIVSMESIDSLSTKGELINE